MSPFRRLGIGLLGPVALRAVLLVASITLAGCTSGHTALGTTTSPCFKALPAAVSAVHHKGTLLGVRRLAASDVVRARRLSELPELKALDHRQVCVVAFRDSYRPGTVDKANPRHSGRYAVVVVDPASDKVAISFVLPRLPLRFRHLGILA